MAKILNESLIYEILSVVEEIPPGRVATYGQLAALIGREKNARLVGKVMSMADFYGSYPCHRVVNAQGRLVPGWREQRALLEEEGVTFRLNGCVNLSKHRWDAD
ncbi:MAG: MGMT family protein [Clostridia bacterium]|nr:MGMT family protein [Clostridia bacterium]